MGEREAQRYHVTLKKNLTAADEELQMFLGPYKIFLICIIVTTVVIPASLFGFLYLPAILFLWRKKVKIETELNKYESFMGQAGFNYD